MNKDTKDVDFDGVWQRIAATIADEPQTAHVPRHASGPMVAAAVFVAVLFAGVGMFLLRRESPEPPAAEQAPPAVTAAVEEKLPAAVVDRGSYELVWESESGDRGRIIWQDETHWRVDRVALTADGPKTVYYEGREGSGRFLSSPEGVEDEGWSAVQDTEVPYEMLLEAHAIADSWPQLGGAEPSLVDPTHPLAATAVTDGNLVVEYDARGLPVLVSGPEGRFAGHGFRVIELEYRPIHQEEYQAPGLSVMYAAHLLPSTTEGQGRLLDDGFVTLQEYTAAFAAAASCSGSAGTPAIDEDSGLFAYADELDPACVSAHLADVEEVWRTQARYLGEDEVATLYYTVTGETDLVAVHEAEAGEEFELGSGDGWTLNVQDRGEGYCYSFRTETTGTEGCSVQSAWQVPDVLSLFWGMSFDDDAITGEVAGFVTTDTASVRLGFTTGDDVVVDVVGAGTGFKALGYAHLWTVDEEGMLATVDALDRDGGVIGSFDVLGASCGEDSMVGDLSGRVPAPVQSDADAASAVACEAGN